ncbi:hypothetical protein BD310DRAFT_115790 [Dichomitus squalens]|uniref:F-box domain-containing protein n=1 Tax=Dichomitus squalens TaxID=114155 RepID=A0A4Q9Q5W4_9APHY|nr:hypothetical protein BD310DRAFT_115790 [Dichomitus squalens]
MIQGMARLVRAYLGYDIYDDRTSLSMTDMHPLFVLASSRHTLATLEVSAYEGVILPHLYPGPFSQLRHLDLPEFLGVSPFIEQNSVTVHDENRKEQQCLGAWKLESAMGGLNELYLSGLSCEVQDLTVFMESFTSYTMLGQLLSNARPSTLYLRTPQPGVLKEDTALPALLRCEGGAQLTALDLHIEFSPEDRDIDLEAGLACLRAALSTTPIRLLKLYLWCFDIPFLEGADVGGLAKTFLDTISPLEMIRLEIGGHRTRENEPFNALKGGEIVVVNKEVPNMVSMHDVDMDSEDGSEED